MPNRWRQRHAQLGFEHWVLDGPPWPNPVGICDLLGTPNAPVSKITSSATKVMHLCSISNDINQTGFFNDSISLPSKLFLTQCKIGTNIKLRNAVVK